MSHHFDTKLAREDPSLNLCDFYLFDGPSGKTVMAMTVNPDVGLSAPDTLHPEGLYAFRFDLNGDAREEVTFKFRFGEPRHGDGSEHTHIQPFVVRKATGDDALRGDAGETLVEGETGSVATDSDVPAYVGIAPELFAASAGFRGFMTAFYKEQRYGADAFLQAEGLVLRHIELDAKHIVVHQGEHISACVGVGLHQAAHIDVALSDVTVKRSNHGLIDLLLVQNLDLGLLRLDVRFRYPHRSLISGEGQSVGVALLQRHPALLNQRFVAPPGDVGKVSIGLRLHQRRLILRQRRLGLGDLMLNLWRRDLHQDIAFFYAAADVDVSCDNVSARASEDVGQIEGQGRAGPKDRNGRRARAYGGG